MYEDHEDHIAYIASQNIWGGTALFGLQRADRRLHTYILGKTGTGKTTLLRNMIAQDIYAGEGVGVIDPHGDLAESLLEIIPSWRTDDVVYFDPSDVEFPVGLNLLRRVHSDQRHLVASGITNAFKGIWHDSWGPRLEYILYAAVAALLECENVTLLGVQRMLIDDCYRDWVMKQVKDPIVRAFWCEEFVRYDKRFRAEIVAPVQNKVGQFLMAPAVRNILSQVRSKIDFRFMMDKKRIFIANLAKGKIGSDKANLLGSFLVTQFQLAAMSRANVKEERREDFHLYVDEFHNFTTESFESILSESRKYRLGLVLSHQMMGQLSQEKLDAVIGNVGTTVAFRVGESDARVLEREFGGEFPARQFSSLSNHEVFVKAVVGGEQRSPFQGRSLPPLKLCAGKTETIRHRSRQRYSTHRRQVEERLQRWVI